MSTHASNPSGGTTDHSEEILAMRQAAARIQVQYPYADLCPDEKRKDATILVAAAALLECHDTSGIALDDWTGPLELVYEGLWLIGKDRPDFLPSGI